MSTEEKPIKHQTQITVSQEEIDKAKKGNSSHCMITNAIKHSNSNAKNVSTDLQTIRWTDRRNNIRYVWLTPAVAQASLLMFDNGDRLVPFVFRMGQPIAETTAGRIATPGSGRPSKKSGRRKVRVRHSGKGSITVTTVGHPLPPVAALPGSRRRFGLKQMKEGLFEPAKKAKS